MRRLKKFSSGLHGAMIRPECGVTSAKDAITWQRYHWNDRPVGFSYKWNTPGEVHRRATTNWVVRTAPGFRRLQ